MKKNFRLVTPENKKSNTEEALDFLKNQIVEIVHYNGEENLFLQRAILLTCWDTEDSSSSLENYRLTSFNMSVPELFYVMDKIKVEIHTPSSIDK